MPHPAIAAAHDLRDLKLGHPREEAHHDELLELRLDLQPKLLRALEEREFRRVGGTQIIKLEARVMAASQRDLWTQVQQGRFREDLYFRLNVVPLQVPPLRARAEDVPLLVRAFMDSFARDNGLRHKELVPGALDALVRWRWPGNVRQLENAVFRAVVLAEGDTIGTREFPQIAAQLTTPPTVADVPLMPAMVEQPAMSVAPSGAVDGAHADRVSLLDAHGDVRPLEDIEFEVIRFAISHYRGQMSEVARRLKIGRSTLYRKLEHLGIEDVKSPVAAE